MKIAFAFLLLLSLSACWAVGPDYVRPEAIVSAQYKEIAGWKIAQPQDAIPKGTWWQIFDDPELDQLESSVAVTNQTLKSDEAAYQSALALLAQSRAGLFPSLNLPSSLTRASPPLATTLEGQVSGSWTLDLWGHIRRQMEADSAHAQASAADLANATLSAQSALAQAYFAVREADSLHDLLAKTVKEYKHALDIAENQYKAGTAAKSDAITAKAQWLAAKAQEINIDLQRKQNEHAIAVLIGKPPLAVTVSHHALAAQTPLPPVMLPSSLLERRPDIAAAERVMAQQNAQIGVEIAGYFPDLTLNGASGYTGTVQRLAASNPAWGYGLTLAQPLFNGGLTAAQVAAAKANYEQSVATYRQTVLTALQQVEDNLAAITVYNRQIRVEQETVAIAKQAEAIALNEYRAGTNTFTTVVTAETTALNDEIALIETHYARQIATLNLIIALGGGFEMKDLPAIH